jgi:poly(A) polymerase
MCHGINIDFFPAKWNWPQPIFLKLPDNLPDIDVGTALWDPRTSMGDRHHLMPIITPSFPHQNSTYNVGRSSLKIMQAEFLRGEDIMNKIYNPKEGDTPTTWSKLFEHLHFFTLYNHFILVIAKARTREELKTWRGCVESRLRILVQQLENNDFVSIAHVLPRDFPIKEDAARPGQAVNAELMPVGVQWFIGLNIPKVEGKPKINLSDDVNAFLTVVRSYGSYSSIMTDGMEVSAKYCLRKGIVDNLPTETIESDPELSILLKGALMQKQKAKPVAPGEFLAVFFDW